MIRVVVCSPYSGNIERNVPYALECVRDSFARGEAPFASHLIYPHVLDDTDVVQRQRGMQAEFEWIEIADLVAFYLDYGWSPGMMKELKVARMFSRRVDRRFLMKGGNR